MKSSAHASTRDDNSSLEREVLLLTCEHGGPTIPAAYTHLFVNGARALASHRGFDPGALPLAKAIARSFHAPLFYSRISRLLVELNRSPHHPALFSEFTRELDRETQDTILQQYYWPHRRDVESAINGYIRAGLRVTHVGVHSFTPVLDGVERRADAGLLYDPARQPERSFCAAWREALRTVCPALRVRKNYPYRGAADGFTTYLRERFSARRYRGIELEINNRWLTGDAGARRTMYRAVVNSLNLALR